MKGNPEKALPLPPGTLLERYTILSVLGQGGFGIAYLVRDENLDRRLLLKEHAPAGLCRRDASTGELHPLPGMQDAYLRSLSDFLQEGVVLSKMRLPSAPEVYEVFESCGTAYVVLSYVEGRALLQWLGDEPDRRSLLPLVLAEALRALGKLHRQGIRHRDIKPGHIILDQAGAVNFIDFGSACAAGDDAASQLVPTFSPPYSPPEQNVAELECAASDLYALAATFYECTLGQKPPAATARLEEGSPDPLLTAAAQDSLQAVFPAAYLASLDKALALEPQDRFATADQWLAALTQPADAKPLPAPHPAYGRRLFAAAFGALLLVAGVFAYYALRAGHERAASAAASPAQSVEEPAAPKLPEVQPWVCELPDGVFASVRPEWQGVCARIDLVDTDDLTEEYLNPVFLTTWRNSRPAALSPARLVLVLTNAEGQEIARSNSHRYDAAARTLSFTFPIPLHTLPEGWQARFCMPHQPLRTPSGKTTPHAARKAVFYTMHATEPPTNADSVLAMIRCPFAREASLPKGANLSADVRASLRAFALAGYPYAARLLAQWHEQLGDAPAAFPWRNLATEWGILE